MDNPLSRIIVFIVVLCVAVGSLGYYVYGQHQESIADEKADDAAEAVTVLPPGTEAAWLAFIDQRISETIIRKNGTVEVSQMGDVPPITAKTFVSLNTPYEISCGVLGGATIEFGYGDNSVTVSVDLSPSEDQPVTASNDPPAPSIGSNDDAPPSGPGNSNDGPPPLGVDISSVAGLRLNNDVCERIVKDVSAIMKNPPGIIQGG